MPAHMPETEGASGWVAVGCSTPFAPPTHRARLLNDHAAAEDEISLVSSAMACGGWILCMHLCACCPVRDGLDLEDWSFVMLVSPDAALEATCRANEQGSQTTAVGLAFPRLSQV